MWITGVVQAAENVSSYVEFALDQAGDPDSGERRDGCGGRGCARHALARTVVADAGKPVARFNGK